MAIATRTSVSCWNLAVDDALAIVTLERPPINALIGPVIDELGCILSALERRDDVRVVILTGGVRNAFSSGGDLDALFGLEIQNAGTEVLLDLFRGMQDTFAAIEAFPKPTIAAINGVCIGAGLELALVCDLRVASELAYFALPELANRIIPGIGATQRLGRVIGYGRAKEMMMVGRRLRAPDALQWGLVGSVTPHRQVLAHARELGRAMAAKPPAAFRALKRVIDHPWAEQLRAGLDNETKEFVAVVAEVLGQLREGGTR